MGTYLELVVTDKCQTDIEVIDAYYDHVAAKERDYYCKSSFDEPEELHADFERQYAKDTLEEMGEVYIYEQLYSRITNNVTIGMQDLFPSYYISGEKDSTIFGDSVEDLINRLRNAKNELKVKDDSKNWELTFETQIIALCEFAIEYDYGIKLA